MQLKLRTPGACVDHWDGQCAFPGHSGMRHHGSIWAGFGNRSAAFVAGGLPARRAVCLRPFRNSQRVL